MRRLRRHRLWLPVMQNVTTSLPVIASDYYNVTSYDVIVAKCCNVTACDCKWYKCYDVFVITNDSKAAKSPSVIASDA